MKNTPEPGQRKSDLVFDTRFKASYLHPKYWFTWIIFGFTYVLYLLPEGFVDYMGSVMGRLLLKFNRKRVNIAALNISLCYPELSEEEKQQFLRRHFIAYGRSLLHYGFIFWGSKKLAEKRIEFHGRQYIDDCIEKGERAIIMIAHSVGLEAAVSTITRNYNLTGPFKDMKNPLVNWFVAKRRGRYGALLYSRDAGLRPIVRDVKAGYVMGYLPDEDLGMEHSIFVPFMGVQKATIPLLGRLTRTCNARAFPCTACYDVEQARYHVHVLPAIEGFSQTDEQQDTRRMNQALEGLIDICPEQYFWTLRFFKTRPQGEKRFY